MFEAKLAESHTFKRIVEAIKDLVNDVNLDVGPAGKLLNNCTQDTKVECLSNLYEQLLILVGISLQAVDTSHVALVSLNLSMEGFESYRCDTNVILGVNIINLSKVMKLANADDSITL